MKRVVIIAAVFLCTVLNAASAREAWTDSIWFMGPPPRVTPGTQFALRFQTSASRAPIHLRVYRLATDEAVEMLSPWVHRAASEHRDVLVWDGTAAGRDLGADYYGNYHYREVAIGPFPIGVYKIEASMGSSSTMLVGNVSTLGLLSVSGVGGAGVWAIDLRTFRRHMGPTTVRIFEDKDTESVVRCDETGLAILKNPPAMRSAFVAQTADGSVDVASPYWYAGDAKHDVQYVQTDRPVYRPGQSVHFRAILRTGYADGYAIPAGSHHVQIASPDGAKIYDRDVTISRFGTLKGDAAVPEDAHLGWYTVSVDGSYGYGFSVQAYKKPEYLIETHALDNAIVGGEDASIDVRAKYFFGRPAAGMHVHYTAYGAWFVPRTYDPYGRYYGGIMQSGLPKQIAGDATTDAAGMVHIRIPTKRLENAYTMGVRVEARDDSGRTVDTSETVTVYPGSIVPELTPKAWYANVGDEVAFDVRSNDLHAKSVGGRQVRIEFRRQVWSSAKGRFDDAATSTQTVTTDSHGFATLRWRAPAPGSYRIAASTVDDRGNTATAYQYLWVVGGNEWWLPPTEEPIVIAQHPALSMSERAHVLIRMPSRGRDALVAVMTDHLVSLRVVHVTGYAISLGIDPPANASRFSVQTFLPSENGTARADVQFTRDPRPKSLRISLHGDRPRYEPGQRASFALRVTDIYGKPVRTEISVGVVDDAVYAVQAEQQQDVVDAFYGNVAWLSAQADWFQPNYVPPASSSEQGVPSGQGRPLKSIARITSRSAGNLVRPGTAADAYSGNNSFAAIPLRTNFQDTAYWTPTVVTDSNGRATVSFTWPDNLTTWRTTSLGVSQDTSVGRAQTESLVTKDFLVRLEMPRFLRKGDVTTIGGIAHGQQDARNVRLRFVPQTADPLDASLRLDGDDVASTSWQLDAGRDLGTRMLALYGTDGRRTDALQLPLPIEATGAAEHVRDAGQLPDRNSLSLALPQGYDAGALTITLTPSITAQLVENLRVLDVYPYYCTEQTMSGALPAVFVDRLLKRTGYALPGDVQPKRTIAHAIARLRQLQHDDGSWGWWENDPAHPFMTAYALYGLAEFKKAGYAVPQDMFERGVQSLLDQLRTHNSDTLRLWGGVQRGSEWNTRAFMFFALADAAPQRIDRTMLDETLHHAPSLNSYALAVLGLAYHELHDDVTAKDVLARLNARARTNGSYTFWSGDTWHYAWQDDPIETTAYALRLNAALAPHSPIVSRTIAFLRSEQHGSWWYTTKDTAASVYAIAEAGNAETTEFAPDESIAVRVDGRTVKTVHITKPILEAAEAQIRVPATSLHNGATVEFVREGRGALYWSTDFTRYAPPQAHVAADSSRSIFARLFPPRPPLQIERRYYAPHSGAWRVGDEIHVELTVSANEDVQYVAIEDPFPAGVEYAPPQGHAGDTSWSGMQFFDDRAVFFATQLSRQWPLHLSYDLRVTTCGTYMASAPISYAMYGPPISAVGDAQHVVVQP